MRIRPALRIARREALRAKGRSVLVLTLIGLPVLAIAGADVAYRTWQLSPTEKIERQIGAADASVDFLGGHVTQSRSGDATQTDDQPASTPGVTAQPTTKDLLAQLPAGSRAIEKKYPSLPVKVRTTHGETSPAFVGLDYADPLARGLVHQVAGRAPRGPGEVALTSTLSHSIGLGIGDVLHVISPARDYRIVGLLTDASYRDVLTAYTLPTALPDSGVDTPSTWLISTPSPVTWSGVLQLNRLGYVVNSRWVALHPIRTALDNGNGSVVTADKQVLATGTLVAGMALLEIVLLAGPAFAVGARRQRRDLALIAAVGGRTADLRNVVLANGVVLGVAAGVIAVPLAVLIARAGLPFLQTYVDQVPGHFDVRPLELAAIALVSLITALAASIIPARAAARTDVVAALAGRRGTTTTSRRVPLIGAVVAALGVVVALGGLTASTSALVILTGVALVELGLIACTPALLGLVSRLGRWLPVSPRIALRDAGRNRSSAAPAVAAVMASVIVAVAVALSVTSINDQDRRNYLPALPRNDAYVATSAASAATIDHMITTIRANLPTEKVLVIQQPRDGCNPPPAGDQTCSSTFAALDQSIVSRYRGGAFPNLLIDDGSAVETLLDTSSPAAVAALRAGRAVVVDPAAVHDGHVTLTLSVTTTSFGPNPALAAPDRSRKVSVPAVAITTGYPSTQVILPPVLARQLGLAPSPLAVLAANSRQPTDREQQAVNAALGTIGISDYLVVETGYHSPSAALLYALIGVATLLAVGAALIATSLANADSRPDLLALAAVGASPRTRRLLSVVAGRGHRHSGHSPGRGGRLRARSGLHPLGPPVALGRARRRWVRLRQPSPGTSYGRAVVADHGRGRRDSPAGRVDLGTGDPVATAVRTRDQRTDVEGTRDDPGGGPDVVAVRPLTDVAVPGLGRPRPRWVEAGQGAIARNVEGSGERDATAEVDEGRDQDEPLPAVSEGQSGAHAQCRTHDRGAEQQQHQRCAHRGDIDRLHRRDPGGIR